MKKIIILILFLFLLINLTVYQSGTKKIRKEKTKSFTLEGIMRGCDKLQSQVNMRIIPSCYLRGMLADLQYTKEEALKYCLDNWNESKILLNYLGALLVVIMVLDAGNKFLTIKNTVKLGDTLNHAF
jgi:hypothetical protein